MWNLRLGPPTSLPWAQSAVAINTPESRIHPGEGLTWPVSGDMPCSALNPRTLHNITPADVDIRRKTVEGRLKYLNPIPESCIAFPHTTRKSVWLHSQRLHIMRAHTELLDRRTQRNFMTLYSPITVLEGVDASTWDVELVG